MIRIAFLLLICCSFLLSCGGRTNGEKECDSKASCAPYTDFGHIAYTVVAASEASANSSLKSGYKLLRSEKEFVSYLNLHLPSEKPWNTDYDFEVGSVIVLNGGRKAHGPYDIGILRLSSLSGSPILDYVTILPGDGCIETHGVTHPYMVIYVHAKIDELIAQETNVKLSCT